MGVERINMNAIILIAFTVGCTTGTPITRVGPVTPFRGIENAIVDGSDARRHQFPYQVSIQKEILGDFEHICGGSIITPTFVVTAGHCIHLFYKMRVVAGLLRMDKVKHKDVQIADVAETFVHPDFDSDAGIGPNDIALIKLATPFKYTKAVKPILLPKPGSEPSGLVQLSGWGSKSDNLFLEDYPNRLQHALLPLITFEECQAALNKTMGDYSQLTPTMICTGSPNGTVSGCFGDSGGPIQQNNRLVGIVLWIVRLCGTAGAPTMYTKTSYYVHFIREIVHDLFR